ncbi:MAG: hypothetical protein Q7J10_00260, partial [Methanosarcinaceae archaeon]|nr:hypothetical protein [Methanosarcinaceae archaeon]
YVKPLCALILIAAVLNSGCISTSSSNTAEDVPVVKAEPETPKILGTTVDGIPHYAFSGNGAFDIDGDGIYDFTDSAVGPGEASRDGGNIAITIRGYFGIPTTSKLHQDYLDIEEFRIRKWDLDGDGHFLDKIEILINGEIVYSSTTDIDGKNGVNMLDAFLELGWW